MIGHANRTGIPFPFPFPFNLPLPLPTQRSQSGRPLPTPNSLLEVHMLHCPVVGDVDVQPRFPGDPGDLLA